MKKGKQNFCKFGVFRLSVICFLFFVSGLSILHGYTEPQKEKIEMNTEIWQGVLKVSGVELRIVFNIIKSEDGHLSATMDSPDQGAKGIPVDEVSIKDGKWIINVKSIGGIFEGVVKGDVIEGKWTQAGQSFPIVLKQIEKVEEVKRPQDPEKPYPYIEREVVYENKRAGIQLAGTLTLPKGGGPFPAVLLITGSGPQNRNEEVFNHRPFWVLADYLTGRGIAVLRVDDRGVGQSTGSNAKATTEDFAEDVLAGIEYLKTVKEINSQKIGLIGHSEGGIIAPMVAVQSKDVAFIVLIAGTGLTGEEILYLQSALISKAEGANNEKIENDLKIQKSLYSVIKKEKDDKIAREKLKRILDVEIAKLSEEEKKSAGDVDAAIEQQINRLLCPWFRFFLVYDPKPILTKVKCPVLAIGGEKDLQVPPRENLSAIKKALKKGKNKDYTVKEIPGLNHLLQTAETGSVSEYAKIEETISPKALKIIGDWIKLWTEVK
jgi:pimeloyl-ACP methyl ester carboxylesterase